MTAGALIYIFATVPPRSVAIEEAVREAAGATVTETVTVTLAAPAPLVQAPAPAPAPVETTPAPAPVPLVETPAPAPAPAPAPPEVVNPGSFCSDPGAPGVTEDGTAMVCTTTAEDDRNRWRSTA